MKAWWNRLERRLDGISYRKKIVCNLVLCAVLLLLSWSRFGFPLPTAELEFRRVERTHLLPRSEIVFNSQREAPVQWGDLPELDFAHNNIVVGAGDGYACVYEPGYSIAKIYPLTEGASPVPVYHMTARWVPSPGTIKAGTPLLFLQVPEDADRAEVEIDAMDREGENFRCRGEGWRVRPGCWLFAVSPGNTFSGDWYAGGSYTLTLYRVDGSLLLEKSGTLGEG